MLRSGLWEISNDLDFLFQGLDTFTVNEVAKEIKGRHTKQGLRDIDDQVMVLEMLQYETEVLKMFLTGRTCYQKVINITKIKIMQHLIHKPLEGLGRIPETKEHADKFRG